MSWVASRVGENNPLQLQFPQCAADAGDEMIGELIRPKNSSGQTTVFFLLTVICPLLSLRNSR